jgi:SAM-dependent MidA family methyltransferase
MKASLYDSVEGYYRRSDLKRWGREGDYRTSPERSDLFAATFARYFARLYDELGRPSDWTIVECGAGDGRFAEVVLRSSDGTRYVVCDSSPDALQRSRERLREFAGRVEFCSEVELPRVEHGVFFSNELFDSFPVHRLVKKHGEVQEMYVTAGVDNEFVWASGPLSLSRLAEFCREHSIELREGQLIEVNLEIEDWLANVSSKLKRGFVITVDYGAEAEALYDPVVRPNGTLRAFSKHGFVDDLLDQPGEYDITSSVNWTQVKLAGEKIGLRAVEFASQDKFLLSAGLLEVLEQRLTKIGAEAEKLSLTTGAREMILPGGMASSFQVLVQRRM